jgi:hypothetical protein
MKKSGGGGDDSPDAGGIIETLADVRNASNFDAARRKFYELWEWVWRREMKPRCGRAGGGGA